MKFRTAQTTLAAAVDRVLNVVPQKTTMAALGHLLIEAEGKHVKLTATDLDLTIQTTIEANILTEGRVTLPAKRFSEIVRQLDPAADVDLQSAADHERQRQRQRRIEHQGLLEVRQA